MKVFLFIILCVVIFMTGLLLVELYKESRKYIRIEFVILPYLRTLFKREKKPNVNIKEVLKKHK